MRRYRQSVFGSTIVVIVLAVMLFAWYLTLESKTIWPENANGHPEQHSSQH